MNKIIFSLQAENSFISAYEYYESKQYGLAERFVHEIEEFLEIIASNPLLFPSKKFDFREASLNVFPFLIIYQLRGETIRILDVFHTSQHPDKKP